MRYKKSSEILINASGKWSQKIRDATDSDTEPSIPISEMSLIVAVYTVGSFVCEIFENMVMDSDAEPTTDRELATAIRNLCGMINDTHDQFVKDKH